MTAELLELTVAEALRRIEAGELSADEYFDAYANAASNDDLNAFLWTQMPAASSAPRPGAAGLAAPINARR